MKTVRSLLLEALEIDGPAERERFLQEACGENLALRRELEQLLALDKSTNCSQIRDLDEPMKTVQSLLLEAFEIEGAAKRERFLQEACGENLALRRELEQLLAAAAASEHFLPETPADGDRAKSLADAAVRLSSEARQVISAAQVEGPGQRIGRYKLLERIGEGGCGVVYMAEQQEPVRRRVALKIIKLGMDTRSVVARFEAERQALALMDHPNIAKVLDAGATDGGRPYFVMDLVRGRKITRYCDEHRLSTRERLNLFLQICQAVQHAHQKGVIHRDLKPSNILVTELDGVPVPKVIDFGIAKATGELQLTDKTLFTAFEQFIGTPAYMSPEQASLGEVDIDTRSDIYSLGVLLYELLTGKTPFENQRLSKAGLDEVCRIIREEEPVRPSTKFHALNSQEQTTIAEYRQLDRPRLEHLIRGDLDWIAMKALEKDRARRYETASGLLMDIQRYLNAEPVLARSPSHLYRFQKIVRRHKGLFSAAGAVTGALVFGLMISLWQAGRATQAEREKSWLLKKARESERMARLAQTNEEQQKQKAEEARQQAEADRGRLAKTLGRIELQRAEQLFASDEGSKAIAHLARMVRESPTNAVAAERLLSALTLHAFARGFIEPLQEPSGMTSVHLSPDGRLLLTTSRDGTSRIWDAQTGRPVVQLLGHGAAVHTGCFSADGKLVATASHDKTARVWDALTGQPVTEPLLHDDTVIAIEFSRDGERILTISADGTARSWGARTGIPLTAAIKFPGPARLAQLSPDGRRVLAVAGDNSVRVYDLQTGQPLTASLRCDGRVLLAQFSPDGLRILTVSEVNEVRIWDAQTGKPLTEALQHESRVVFVQFSPDGQKVMTLTDDKTARIWNLQATEQSLPHMFGGVLFARFSPDGQRMVSASDDKTIRLRDARTGQPVAERLQLDEFVWDLQWSDDGQRLVALLRDGTARLFEVTALPALTQRVTSRSGHPRTIDLRDPASTASFSSDGRRFVLASFDGTATVWDSRTERLIGEPLRHSARVHSAEFSPDGKRVVTSAYDKTARVWDVQTGLPLTSPLQHEDDVEAAEFSPDGQVLLTGSDDRTARIWNARTGQPIGEPFKHRDQIYDVRFSPDGRRIVTASADHSARVWDIETCQPITPPLKHGAALRAVEFSRDGKWVVTASDDHTARVWDARTGQPVTEPLRHEAGVVSARFSPDGLLVVTASDDQTARVWDARTGELLSQLKHVGAVRSAEFSPDGRRVVTASFDGTARLWDVQTGQPLSEKLRHEGWVWSATFSPDGQRVLTTSSGTNARIWEVPSVSLPVPSWVPDLAEALVGQRAVDYSFEPIGFAPLPAAVTEALGSSATDPWTRWAKWFLADPLQRAISPGSEITVPDHVQRLIDENSLASLQEAVRLAPTNPLALAGLARALLAQATPTTQQIAEAQWYSSRALKFAPNTTAAWLANAEALNQNGQLPGALEALRAGMSLQPDNPDFWLVQARLLEQTNQLAEAFQSFTKAIELSGANAGTEGGPPQKYYLSRSLFLERHSRFKEAAADMCRARGFPLRDPTATPSQIDLSLYYNAWLNLPWHPGEEGSDLSSLPRGNQVLAGVTFDVRGLIQAGTRSRTGQKYPQKIAAMKIGQRCKRIHFLHSAVNCFSIDPGTQIGSYLVHYADGRMGEIPLRVGQELADWWSQPKQESDRFSVAWEGTNGASRKAGRMIRLFKTTWENPSPEAAVESIDLLSTDDTAAPFLVAITVE